MEGVRLGRPPSAELRLRTALLELDQRPRLPAAIECGYLARRDRALLRSISVMYSSTAPSHSTPHCPGARCHHRPHGTGDGARTGYRRLFRRAFGERLRTFRSMVVTQTRLQTRPRSPLRCRGLWRGLWRGPWRRLLRGLRLVEERALDRVGEWAVFVVVRHALASWAATGAAAVPIETKREVWRNMFRNFTPSLRVNRAVGDAQPLSGSALTSVS